MNPQEDRPLSLGRTVADALGILEAGSSEQGQGAEQLRLTSVAGMEGASEGVLAWVLQRPSAMGWE